VGFLGFIDPFGNRRRFNEPIEPATR